MQMTFRWYGVGNDTVTLDQIKQIPGVTGIVWALHDKQPGEVWEINEIQKVKDQLDKYGFNMDVVESVNVHDDIKIGLPTRDKYIENYKQTLRNLKQFGVKVVCYNFMPIFDWTRTDLFHPVGDGSTALYYEKDKIIDDPKEMAKYILEKCDGLTMPGWEPERMARLNELFEAYKDVTKEKLWENLKYFLEQLMPTCRECDIKLAIHQDDPPWDIFGLPRLLVDAPSIDRFLSMVDDPYNCLTLCSGSMGSNPDNNVADIIRAHCDRIAFAHVRNVKHFPNGDFSEASHRDCDGDVGILDIMKAYHDCHFDGYMRPDHGRHIWGEKCRPGYGLYDRALGIMYLLGCWDMLEKQDKNLTLKGISRPELWENYRLPKYDIAKMKQKTTEAPQWLHFGSGNIFRAFLAKLQDNLLDEGVSDTGIICAESHGTEIVTKCYRPHDNLTISVTLNPDGSMEKRVLASVSESLTTAHDLKRIEEIFCSKSLKMVSFTITEKGYAIKDSKGELFSNIQADINAGPNACTGLMAILASMCIKRMHTNELPLALVSMDNCSHNGDKLKSAVTFIARSWYEKGMISVKELDFVENKISYPWTMIDKITPRPDKKVERTLIRDGINDVKPFVTENGTFIAPFVNAEAPEYLVIEDDFPNGKIALDKAGVIYTDRETVNKVEKMKVCTCLNPLHTCLAVYGCLLRHTLICEEMKDEVLKKFITKMAYEEGMPVVTDPGIIKPADFLEEVLNKRLPNPFMPDAPQRIATDTSQKLPIRFGETIKAYATKGSAADLKYIPLVLAGWLRYLMAVDDEGNTFEPSADPYLREAQSYLSNVKLGDTDIDENPIKALLSNKEIFGADICEVGLADKVLAYFKELIKGEGAVRATLEKYVF